MFLVDDAGFTSDIVDAIVWASGGTVAGLTNTNPADIINMSLGSQRLAATPTYQSAIDAAANAVQQWWRRGQQLMLMLLVPPQQVVTT